MFLERIMSESLENHYGKVSIRGRNITIVQFADGLYAPAEEQQELESLGEVATNSEQGIRWRSVLRRPN